jgi:holliday junction DNA helicase RuvA
VIASIEGVVGAISPESLVIEVGGLGYRVFAGPGTLARAHTGQRLRLHTHHLVREDAQALYGFGTTEELGFFTLLLTVTGVGPKVALAIVAARPVADLQLAVLQGDEAVLTAVTGVGKKLAARICLELREKVSAAGMAASLGSGQGTTGAQTEVVAALQALGYSSGEAREAARAAADQLAPGTSLEDRVKAALQSLRRE